MVVLMNRIRYYRESKGLSIRELAGYLHVSPETIRRWETDEQIPNVYTAKKICALFGKRIEDVFLGNGPKRDYGRKMPVS